MNGELSQLCKITLAASLTFSSVPITGSIAFADDTTQDYGHVATVDKMLHESYQPLRNPVANEVQKLQFGITDDIDIPETNNQDAENQSTDQSAQTQNNNETTPEKNQDSINPDEVNTQQPTNDNTSDVLDADNKNILKTDADAVVSESEEQPVLLAASESPETQVLSFTLNDADHSAVISGVTKEFAGGELVIPATIEQDGETYNVTAINKNAFKRNRNITSVVLPVSVETIGANAFDYCSNLKSVSMPGVKVVENYAFNGCSALDVTLPDTLTTIGMKAFYNTSITQVTIPASVTEIGSAAFSGCKKLTSAVTTDVLVDKMFQSCPMLESVTVPDSVTAIPDYMFDRCAKLAAPVFPTSLTTIGKSAFAGTGITEVTMPESVTTLSDSVFKGCKSLLTATTTEVLAEYMFDGCSALTTVSVPDTVTAIPGHMFNGCAALDHAVFPAQVTSIGRNAFAGTAISTVSVPETVTFLGISAFAGCKSLESAILPASLAFVDHEAADQFSQFDGCTSLTSVNLPEGSTVMPYGFVRGCTSLTEFTIPATVTEIKGQAFMGCTGITALALPENLTILGDGIFADCTGIKTLKLPSKLEVMGSGVFKGSAIENIIIPDSVTELGKDAFRGCTTLTNVDLGKGMQVLGESAFADCTGITSIALPEGLTTISKLCFSNTGLTAVELPASVDVIAESVFKGSKSLASVTFNAAPSTLERYAFQDCTSLTTIDIPAGVTEIPDGLFKNCSALASVTLSSTVNHMGSMPFGGCTALTSLQFPDNMTMDKWFQGSGIVELDMSNINLAAATNMQFANSPKLSKVVLPSMVSSVHANAFRNCPELKTVVFCGEIPSDTKLPTGAQAQFRVRYIVDGEVVSVQDLPAGSNAVAPEVSGHEGMTLEWSNDGTNITAGCDITASWTAEAEKSVFTFAFDEDAKTAVITGVDASFAGDLVIPAAAQKDGVSYTVTAIAKNAFKGNTAITSVYVSDGIPQIGAAAFQNCTSLTRAYLPDSAAFSAELMATPTMLFSGCASLTDVRIPEGSQVISSSMFGGCTALTNVVIPGSVTEIRNRAFSDCTALESIDIPESVSNIDVAAFSGCSSLDNAVIPSAVTTLNKNVFAGCTNLASVSLPSTMTVIDAEAFFGCSSLKGIQLPSSLTTIETQAFTRSGIAAIEFPASVETIATSAFEKSALESVVIPASVKTLGEGAFANCNVLTEATIEGDIASMGGAVFMDDTALTNVTLGEGVTVVPLSTFNGCTALTDVVLPSTLTTIENSAFNACTALTSIDLPANLTSLGQLTFAGCTKLARVHVPGGVEVVGAGAFQNCTSLNDVTLDAGIKVIGNEAFYNCIQLRELVVPATVIDIHLGAFNACDRLTRLVFDGFMPTCEGKVMSSNVVCYHTIRFFDQDKNLIGEPQIVRVGDGAVAPEFTAPEGSEFSGWSEDFSAVKDSMNIYPVMYSVLQYFFNAEAKTATVVSAGAVSGADIVIPETVVRDGVTYTVTGIGTDAFKGVQKVKQIFVPASVTTIDSAAMADMPGLSAVILAGAEPVIATDAIPGAVVLKFTVKFLDADGVQIGNSVYVEKGTAASAPEAPAVEGSAFAGWDRDTTQVTTSFETKAVYDVDYMYAFNDTDRTATLTHIGRGVSGAVELPQYVRHGSFNYTLVAISDGCTDDTAALTELIVPAKVATIGENAFAQASALTKVTLRGNTQVAPSAFADSVSMYYTVVFKSRGGSILSTQTVLKGESATAPVAPEVKGYTFTGWSCALENITSHTEATAQYEEFIPEGQEDFAFVFDEATKTATLTETSPTLSGNIKIPATAMHEGEEYSVVAIGKAAFDRRDKVTGVEIPQSVTKIGFNAFARTGITEVVIPSSVETLENSVFFNCKSLKKADIQAPLYELSAGTFNGCEALETLTMTPATREIGSSACKNCSSLKGIDMSQFYSIGFSAFENNAAMTDIELSDDLIDLGSYAFKGCGSVTKVTIPEGIETVGSSTFADCTGLTTVVLPQSITLIDKSAFSGCTGLKDINLSDTHVVTVSDSAFQDCQSLVYADMPDTLVTLGNRVFRNCYNLEHFVGGTSLVTIGQFAFENCYKLHDVVLSEGLKTIGQWAFASCTGLVEIHLPDSLESVEASLFRDCINLKKVNIPTSMDTLAGGMFQNCEGLEEIEIPSNITHIGDSVFNGCTGIKHLEIPDSVVQIGSNMGQSGRPWQSHTFAGMTSLESIKLPAGLTSIAAGLFDGCTNLETVYIPEGVTEINIDAFKNSGVKNIIFMGDNKGEILLRDNAIPEGSTLYTYAEWEALQQGSGSGSDSQGQGGQGGQGSDGSGSQGQGGVIINPQGDNATTDKNGTEQTDETEAKTESASQVKQEIATPAPKTGDDSKAEKAQEEVQKETNGSHEKLSVIEVVKKALKAPAVCIGLIITVILGLIAALLAGAAYRVRKFKDQTK